MQFIDAFNEIYDADLKVRCALAIKYLAIVIFGEGHHVFTQTCIDIMNVCDQLPEIVYMPK